MRLNLRLIRELRILKGFSQEYVAHFLDISQSKYCRLESGAAVFDINVLSKLVCCLQVSPLRIIIVSEEIRGFMKNNSR